MQDEFQIFQSHVSSPTKRDAQNDPLTSKIENRTLLASYQRFLCGLPMGNFISKSEQHCYFVVIFNINSSLLMVCQNADYTLLSHLIVRDFENLHNGEK